MTKSQFRELLIPLMEAAAAMPKVAERLVFWEDVADHAHACVAAEVATRAAASIADADAETIVGMVLGAADIAGGFLTEVDESEVPDKIKEATRRIMVIYSPYQGREVTEGMWERILIDSQKVLDELGIEGRVEAHPRGVLIIPTSNSDRAATAKPIVEQIEEMPDGVEREFMTAVDALVVLVTKLAAPQRDIELRKLASYMRRRTGEIARKYDAR